MGGGSLAPCRACRDAASAMLLLGCKQSIAVRYSGTAGCQNRGEEDHGSQGKTKPAALLGAARHERVTVLSLRPTVAAAAAAARARNSALRRWYSPQRTPAYSR